MKAGCKEDIVGRVINAGEMHIFTQTVGENCAITLSIYISKVCYIFTIFIQFGNVGLAV